MVRAVVSCIAALALLFGAVACEHTSEDTSEPEVVSPGSYCRTEGSTGVTEKGTKMVCSKKAGQDRARWRSAE